MQSKSVMETSFIILILILILIIFIHLRRYECVREREKKKKTVHANMSRVFAVYRGRVVA